MTDDVVGFIGLGNMGRPIAENIAKAGYDMVPHDVAGTQARAPEGTRIAGSGADVARGSNLIFLSLPSVAAMEAVTAEIAGAGAPEGAVVVNTSTIGPDAALAAIEALAARGIGYVDAPISGSTFRAREGSLAVMYSGDEATLARLTPIFKTYAANGIFDIGRTPGSAQRMKLVNNSIAISSFVTISEALSMGVAGGLEVGAMLDVINASSGQSFVTENLFSTQVVTELYDSESTAKIAGSWLACRTLPSSARRRRPSAAATTRLEPPTPPSTNSARPTPRPISSGSSPISRARTSVVHSKFFRLLRRVP